MMVNNTPKKSGQAEGALFPGRNGGIPGKVAIPLDDWHPWLVWADGIQ